MYRCALFVINTVITLKIPSNFCLELKCFMHPEVSLGMQTQKLQESIYVQMTLKVTSFTKNRVSKVYLKLDSYMFTKISFKKVDMY